LTCVEIDPPDGESDWHAQAPQLLKVTTFGATMMARAKYDMGMSFHAISAMVEGVERPYDAKREVQHEWSMHLPPAATWVLIAGEKLYELCFSDVVPRYANTHATKLKWGGRAFCAERWALWKQQFQTLASTWEIDEPCRVFAARAAQKMGELEHEH